MPRPALYRLAHCVALWLSPLLVATCSLSDGSDLGLPNPNGTPDSVTLDPLVETAEGQVAFVDINVVPMDSERVLTNQTVVVDGGRITALGPATDVTVPDEAIRLDGTGRYLMPGLADMHVHLLAEEDLLLFVANGITTIRIMWGYDDVLTWRNRANRGDILAPKVYTTSPGLDGPPGYWPLTVIVRNAAEGRAAVAAQKAAGYDFIKVYSSLSRSSYDAIMEAAADHNIRVMGHLPNSVSLEHAIASGQASIAHVSSIRRAVTSNPDLARAMRDADVWGGPTITVQMRTIAEANAWQNHPAWQYLSSDLRNFMETPQARPRGSAGQGFHNERNRAIRTLRDAGVGLLLGTDNGIRAVLPGYSIHEELHYLVEAGLTPFEALRAGTADAARFLRTTADEGTIAVGKRANVLLLNANPLDDVRHVARRSGVMLRGQWFSEAKLQAMLSERAQTYRGNE